MFLRRLCCMVGLIALLPACSDSGGQRAPAEAGKVVIAVSGDTGGISKGAAIIDMAVSRDGILYLALRDLDPVKNRVLRIDPGGRAKVAVDAKAVAEIESTPISVPEGYSERSGEELYPKGFDPLAIAVDDAGHLLVLDRLRNSVYRMPLESEGSKPVVFLNPGPQYFDLLKAQWMVSLGDEVMLADSCKVYAIARHSAHSQSKLGQCGATDAASVAARRASSDEYVGPISGLASGCSGADWYVAETDRVRRLRSEASTTVALGPVSNELGPVTLRIACRPDGDLVVAGKGIAAVAADGAARVINGATVDGADDIEVDRAGDIYLATRLDGTVGENSTPEVKVFRPA